MLTINPKHYYEVEGIRFRVFGKTEPLSEKAYRQAVADREYLFRVLLDGEGERVIAAIINELRHTDPKETTNG